MDDLQLVRELDETPLKSADQLAAARARLVAGMRPPRRGRAGIIAVAALTAAATVTAVALVLPSTSTDPVRHDAAPTESEAAVDTAVQLLNHAAAAARSKPDQVPRPDQFYYVRDGGWEAWFSVDGTRDGRIITAADAAPSTTPGCVDGVRKVLDKYDKPTGATEKCTPVRAYRDDLPTSADEMLRWLKGDDKDRPVNSYGKDVLGTFRFAYLPGPQRAALFEAATQVPGLTVVKKVSAGRPGIGISWPVPEGSAPWAEPVVMVFDEKTYEYLGTKNEPQDASGFVDRVGDRV
ncbi:CU044_5270 family protein [Lentzea sp. BCCO 10_0798]|uniref:CU044_5270 family protein n=1 Tax=Lentzea kristufekii TaxID=3095430 RepID=A0ABU4TQX7_9PSEU|nr:CU044_5270 family protein [Lentzea sp. BCCO 10_0798]MDX8050688.1 CU044_5270 family protein [Lentzea sp. BCCO 10_0798]